MKSLSLLYRGPLSSCNYSCGYCPFAKRRESLAEHRVDQQALERFLSWVEERRQHRLSIFFTPWGEALIRRRYQRALVRLTALPQVRRAVIQTNLSCRLDWVQECDRSRLALWCTYHPSQVPREQFLGRCQRLHQLGARFSVGVVGLKEHLEEIQELRSALPAEVYLWVNAYKRVPGYYTPKEVSQLTALDPHFPLNNQRHASQGLECSTGHEVVSVDGRGDLRRCHFVSEVIGNLYEADWEQALRPRLCPQPTCGCHIGYVHLRRLSLERVFGESILERIPEGGAPAPPEFSQITCERRGNSWPSEIL